jgi:hypothetical protein
VAAGMEARRSAMRLEARQRHTGGAAEQILGEIRDYCHETQTAESTFGRRAVNDGSLSRACATARELQLARSTK